LLAGNRVDQGFKEGGKAWRFYASILIDKRMQKIILSGKDIKWLKIDPYTLQLLEPKANFVRQDIVNGMIGG
jgi:hypothetical protein